MEHPTENGRGRAKTVPETVPTDRTPGKRVLFDTWRPRSIIYGLIDPLKPRHIYYVGVTAKHPAQRYASHMLYWRREDGDTFQPVMVLLEDDVPLTRLFVRECRWIRRLRRIGMADANKQATESPSGAYARLLCHTPTPAGAA